MGGDCEGGGQFDDSIGAHGGTFAFPVGDGLLSEAELLSELGLGKTGLLAVAGEPGAEAGARVFGGSASWMHGGIIRVGRRRRGARNKEEAHSNK